MTRLLHHYFQPITIAKDVAMQFATWVSSYEYIFPVNSTLRKLNKTTTGVVWANTQHKHGAPGICTHSGWALLKLYLSSGNEYYLHLLHLIAKAIPPSFFSLLKCAKSGAKVSLKRTDKKRARH